MYILQIKNLKKSYKNQEVLKEISLNVFKNELLCIMGSSGSGKTTLLNCISTIDLPTSGEVIFNNNDITKIKKSKLADFRKNNIGFIFQNYNLLNTLNVRDNILLPLVLNKISINEMKEKVNKFSKILGLENILNKYPYEISGGQKQRVASIRAMITEPKIIFADEPTGALDSNSSKTLMKIFKQITEKFETTILMVTHDPYIASYSNRVVFLKDGYIYKELNKNNLDKDGNFYDEILKVVSSMEVATNE